MATKTPGPKLWRGPDGSWIFCGIQLASVVPGTAVYAKWIELFPELTEPADLPKDWTP